MAAVFIADATSVPEIAEVLARRRELELDRFDEVWEGVLHMSPPPHLGHQGLLGWLYRVFDAQARRYGLGAAYIQVGLREPGTPHEGPLANYRVPDLALLPPGYEPVGGWIEDGALLVIEVRSTREEAVRKLRFYAARKVVEALYVDWRTAEFEVFRLAGGEPIAVSPDREGFSLLRTIDLRVRRIEGGGAGRLEVEDARGGGPLPPP